MTNSPHVSRLLALRSTFDARAAKWQTNSKKLSSAVAVICASRGSAISFWELTSVKIQKSQHSFTIDLLAGLLLLLNLFSHFNQPSQSYAKN